jgi:hypothetical protein
MRHAALVATILLGAGCGFLPSVPPDWVTNRLPLDSCGEEVLGQGEAGDVDVRMCLLEAYEDGSPAEMISTQPTIEGDPITRYIRVHENGVVEIFVDATRDQFGSGEWERLQCEEIVSVDEANDPPNLVFPADMVFVEDQCRPQPVP